MEDTVVDEKAKSWISRVWGAVDILLDVGRCELCACYSPTSRTPQGSLQNSTGFSLPYNLESFQSENCALSFLLAFSTFLYVHNISN